MTPQQQAALQALAGRELTAPELQAAVAHVAAGNMEALAALLSAGRTKVVSHFASERGVLERYPGGPLAADALLGKLEAFAATDHPMARIVGRALKFLAQAEGLDLGSAATQGLLQQLALGGVITEAERLGLRQMTLQPDPIHWHAVRDALQEGT